MRRGAIPRAGRGEPLRKASPAPPLALLLLSCLLWPAASGAAERPVVQVGVDTGADGTRVILTHSRRVGYIVETSRGNVRIRYAEPVDVRPDSQRFDDPILERYRMRDERTLALDTGSAYERYETFELENPFRVVIDLKPEPPRERGSRRARRKPTIQPETIVVLDPGHGGVEHGAVGPSGLMEKDVTLALARRLKRELERGGRRISVVLTRDEDRLVGLDERTAVANHNRAELFVSIHVNASPRAEAHGAETYYLSTDATDGDASLLAEKENLAQGGKRADEKVAEGSLDLVLWDLAQNQYLAESSALAESVQSQLNVLTGTRNRGVRQAPFRVLMGATMPAVLVEVGFISNREEEERLRSATYQAQVVGALAAAVEEFLANLERYTAPDSSSAGKARP